MHRIVVFSTHDGFCLDLRAELRGRVDVTVVISRSFDELVSRLDDDGFEALVADLSLLELSAEEVARLTEITEHQSVLVVGAEEEPPQAEWTSIDDLQGVADWVDNHLEPEPGEFEQRPESASYFVGDTQGRSQSVVQASEQRSARSSLAHHTSEVERAQSTPSRLLYVGPRDEFRRTLEKKSPEYGVAAAFADSPERVALSNSADALDVAVFALDDASLPATRRAIRFLRHQQVGIPFEIALLSRADESVKPALARSLGADALLRGPLEATELLERVAPVTGQSENVEIVIVSPRARRAHFIESALSREPVNLFVTDSIEEAVGRFEATEPDIAVVDAGFDGASTDESVVGRFRRIRRFGLTRFVRILASDQSVEPATRLGVDDLLIEPLRRADVRRVIRRQAAQLAYGRLTYERDALTGVSTALVLAESLQAMLDPAKRGEESVVVSAIDIDGLSTINQRYGRIIGDAILRSLADALRIAVDEPGRIFRTSEDEFFVLQRTADGDWASCRDRLERALRAFETQTLRAADGRGAFATTSAGAIVVPPVAVSAEFCIQKCLMVQERSARTDRDGVLVAHLDPEAFPEAVPEHDRASERD
ncbi:MAG: diguanylate cyclase domain-containing protein [Persicimonas sp.]